MWQKADDLMQARIPFPLDPERLEPDKTHCEHPHISGHVASHTHCTIPSFSKYLLLSCQPSVLIIFYLKNLDNQNLIQKSTFLIHYFKKYPSLLCKLDYLLDYFHFKFPILDITKRDKKKFNKILIIQ